MTEEQAKEKWCPFAQAPLEIVRSSDKAMMSAVIANRGSHPGDIHVNSLCLGSGCMAWRWREVMSRDNPARTSGTGHKPGVKGGYCGLAGQP